MSLLQKVEIINYAKDHPSAEYQKVAENFNIGRTQAQKILKERDAMQYLLHMKATQSQMSRRESAKYTNVNEAVWDWYVMCRSSNIPVSGMLPQEEALILAEKMGIKGFAPSNGWLECLKKQHNIHNMTIAGEVGDVRDETIESWNERAREVTKGWKPENVWNTDETGCFWKGLPETSLNEKGWCCTGGKQVKQRTNWAFFVNVTGEKEDPIVIGNYQKPRCFKNLRDTKCPYRC